MNNPPNSLPSGPCMPNFQSYPSAILVFFNRWAAGTASAPPDYVFSLALFSSSVNRGVNENRTHHTLLARECRHLGTCDPIACPGMPEQVLPTPRSKIGSAAMQYSSTGSTRCQTSYQRSSSSNPMRCRSRVACIA